MSLIDDLEIDLNQYADLVVPFTWETGPNQYDTTTVDLTGCTARMMVRLRPEDAAPIVSISNVVNSQGVIVLGGTAGTIQLSFTPAATALLDGVFGYEIMITMSTGVAISFARGTISAAAGYVH